MMVNFLTFSVIIGLFIGTSLAGRTSFTFKTHTQLQEDVNLVLYQLPETPTPGINTDVIAWKILNVQGSGGGASVPVPFDLSVQASIETIQGDILFSSMIPAKNGNVLTITKGEQGALNLNVDKLDTAGEAGLDIIKVNNNYDFPGKPPTIKVACFKNGKKLVELNSHFKGSNVQFKIYPILYAAWSSDIKEGETFKAGIFAKRAEAIYFLNPIDKVQPGKHVDVQLSLGTNSELQWSYKVDGLQALPLPAPPPMRSPAPRSMTFRASPSMTFPEVDCTSRCVATSVVSNVMKWTMACQTHKNCWVQKVSVLLPNCLSSCTNLGSVGAAPLETRMKTY